MCAKDAVPEHKELAMPSMLIDMFLTTGVRSLTFVRLFMSIRSAFISSILEPILAYRCKTGVPRL